MPLWLPNGTVLVEELEKLAKETEFMAGYVRVKTPHLAKAKMYWTSEHLKLYTDSMFPPVKLEREMTDADRARTAELKTQREPLATRKTALGADALNEGSPAWLESTSKIQKIDEEISLLEGHFYLKAMNCPHHHRIFAAEPRSYRDLPLRLAEYGTCYRYEQSGELFGLMRVRSLNMNDAHIYCTEEQFADEFRAVNDMYLKYFKIFGLEKYQMRFSTHSSEGLGKKYVNEPELWKKTEDMARRVLVARERHRPRVHHRHQPGGFRRARKIRPGL
jgi:threonyl-tRNA synthetase